MGISKPQIFRFIGLPIIAAVATFIVLMVSASVISILPRPMQGESVSAPWSVCLFGVLGTTLVLPWIVSLPFLKQSRSRIYFFVCLAIAVAAWYFLFDFDQLLSKAYRRGL
jgi:hypothetical protein